MASPGLCIGAVRENASADETAMKVFVVTERLLIKWCSLHSFTLTKEALVARLDLFIAWEIQSIQRFLDEVPEFLARRAAAEEKGETTSITKAGLLSDAETWLAARTLAHEAVVYCLNALVDWVLLALAARILPDRWASTAKALCRSRQQLIKAVEEHYGIDVRALPSWSQVDSLRENANAFKHRGGSSLPTPTEFGIPFYRRPDLSQESLCAQVAAVNEWLLALWQHTEGFGQDEG